MPVHVQGMPVQRLMGPGGAFTSPQWSDNVARMYQFMERHPEVEITLPMQNGTPDFIASWLNGDARDRSLGWLLDHLEKLFPDGLG